MLRAFEHLRRPADSSLLIAGDEELLTIRGSGASYAMPWHWHDCLMLLLPSEGAVELTVEERREGMWLSDDRFAIVPANFAHQTRSGIEAHRHVALYVTGASLLRLDDEVGSLAEFRRRTTTTTLVRRTQAIRALQELSLRPDTGRYGGGAIRSNLSAALLVQCIAEVVAGQTLSRASHGEHAQALVTDIRTFLTLHAIEEVPLEALAARFGVSRRHITRLFREKTGLSIGEYQQQQRLGKAADLLAHTDLPVGEIAFRVGFDSGAALARAMQRVNGHAPSDIRSRMARLIKR